MRLWKGHLWSTSYCLLTTGQTTLDVLKRYVESQGEEGNRVICVDGNYVNSYNTARRSGVNI